MQRARDAEQLRTGYLRNQYMAPVSTETEESKLVRLAPGEDISPVDIAYISSQELQRKLNVLGAQVQADTLHQNGGVPVLVNGTFNRKVSFGLAPNKQSRIYQEFMKYDPASSADRDLAKPPTQYYGSNFRDQFGMSDNRPTGGYNYVWPDQRYFGNPWNAGGQLASHFREGQRKDNYMWPDKNNTGHSVSELHKQEMEAFDLRPRPSRPHTRGGKRRVVINEDQNKHHYY